MMVSAFAGSEFIKEAYNEAIKEKYKFYSYGDAMLILWMDGKQRWYTAIKFWTTWGFFD